MTLRSHWPFRLFEAEFQLGSRDPWLGSGNVLDPPSATAKAVYSNSPPSSCRGIVGSCPQWLRSAQRYESARTVSTYLPHDESVLPVRHLWRKEYLRCHCGHNFAFAVDVGLNHTDSPRARRVRIGLRAESNRTIVREPPHVCAKEYPWCVITSVRSFIAIG
jgi:hypothetical protein